MQTKTYTLRREIPNPANHNKNKLFLAPKHLEIAKLLTKRKEKEVTTMEWLKHLFVHTCRGWEQGWEKLILLFSSLQNTNVKICNTILHS